MIISFLLLACGEKEESNPSSTETDPTTEWDVNPQPATEPSEPSQPTTEPTAAESFCSLFAETCGDFPINMVCEDWYNAAEAGNEGDASGASQACYSYHLEVAAADTSADPANGSYSAHCDHAAGLAVCVEPQTQLEGLTLGATLLDFGSVDLGTGPTELISITNNGPTDVTVTIIHASDPAFDLSGSSPFDVGNTIAVGDTVQLGVEFYPTVAQTYNATMTITSDSTVTPEITFDLTGIGVNPTTTPTYTYTNDISSILSSCMGCHGSSGGFTLNYSNLFTNSTTGMPYITPGDTSQSYLWKKINGTGSGANMSQKPGVNLSTSDFSTIETWITEGAAE